MSRYHTYLHTAAQFVEMYDGSVPFSIFLKKLFAAEKKYGSTDRKLISHLSYCKFRTGRLLDKSEATDQVIFALFLCSTAKNKVLDELAPDLNERTSLTIFDKLSLLRIPQHQIDKIFPFDFALSESINRVDFCLSHLLQPDLFLRIRPGHHATVEHKLNSAGITFQRLNPESIALPNGTKVEAAVILNQEVVVQDYNSQKVKEYFPASSVSVQVVWDSCAASGGKAIMAYDYLPGVKLVVSDIRKSIVSNLRKRFSEAGIRNFESFVADASSTRQAFHRENLLIIADVPCSGSGTWGRTPEQLVKFSASRIAEYVNLQKKIVTNLISHLKNGDHLLYVTCSVFREENENVVEYILQYPNLELVKMNVLIGYEKRADTMFAALIQKVES